MKIDTAGLKSLFQAQVRSKPSRLREDCPGPEKIVRLLRSEVSRRKATKIIDHISRCSDCAGELELLLGIFRQEETFIQETKAWLAGQKTPGRRVFSPCFSWRTASILAGSVLIVLAVLATVVLRLPERYRAGPLAKVVLLQPVGEKMARSSLAFRWQAIPGSEYYIIELFDEGLQPIWKSDKISQNRFIPPSDLVNRLSAKKPYFWMVTAFAGGEKTASSLEEFVLID
jgi:hypothetical protein